MEKLFYVNYDEQGINAEGAVAYHYANFRWWSIARERLMREGLSVPSCMEWLEEAPLELAHATKPDGTFVSIGDTDGGRPKGVDYPAALYAATKSAEGEAPEQLIKVYDAGYLFARSGWGDKGRAFEHETFFSVVFGEGNKIHGNPDGTSVTYSSGGTEWVTDPGKYSYNPREQMRKFCLSRESHSLTYIKGRDYDSTRVVACTRKYQDDDVYDYEFLDEGYKGVRLTRRLVYSVAGEFLVVIDAVRSQDACTAVQNWQLGSRVTTREGRRGVQLGDDRDTHGVLWFTGTSPEIDIVKGQESPWAGWVSTGWRKHAPAPAVRFRKSGTRFRFVTVLAVGPRGNSRTPEITRFSSAPSRIHLQVDTGRIVEEIVIDGDSAGTSRIRSLSGKP